MSLLEVKNLAVHFGAAAAVRDVSFSLRRGERLGIVGESGSGKTMTSLAIAGLLPDGAQMSGLITIDDHPLPSSERAMARLRGQRLGMVFQEPMTALNPLMRISEQINEAIRLSPTQEGPDVLPSLLTEVGLEPAHGHRYPHQLSGGQRQRVMIAMALASHPDVLIADEPTSALDIITQRAMLDLVAAICSARNMALLFISHDLKAVAYLCSRVLVMNNGLVVEHGPAEAVLRTPAAPYTQKLVGAAKYQISPYQRPQPGPMLLDIEGVTRDYRQGSALPWGGKKFRAVDDAGFDIKGGECLALVGPSGCGKTTLARIVSGLDRASAGEMRLHGRTYHGDDLPGDLRKDISLVFQDPFGSLNPRLTIAQSVGEPLRLEARADRQARLEEAVLAVGLEPAVLDRYPHEFSGGQRQRLVIARALITRPKLVVLDEPVSALDLSIRGEVLDLLRRLQHQHQLTYLLISHDLDMVRAVADRVLIMQAGRIVEEGTPETIFGQPQHAMTKSLVAARLPDIG
jgi:peptide/nickel transport system ATP-binding protein